MAKKENAGGVSAAFAAAAASPLFAGAEDAAAALSALRPRVREYARGVVLLRAGERCACFGLIGSGAVDVVREDAGGNPVTVARLAAGELFAEAFAFGGLPASAGVVAAERACVFWIEAEKIGGDAALAANMLRAFARKNLFLTERIEHLSRRSLAEKVLSYLAAERRRAGRAQFCIPFDRAALADYLGCDRSALSAVLSRLRAAGVLDYHKNSFCFPDRPR